MVETGVLLPMSLELRMLMYLSDKVEARFVKNANAAAKGLQQVGRTAYG